jgi:hypothetical protein
MSRRYVTGSFVVLILVPLIAHPSLALEKVSRRAMDADHWSASTTGTIRYYNNCTGWVWVWSGWSSGETTGVRYDARFSFCLLNVSWALTFSGAPAGYGFTGTIAVRGGHTCAAPVLLSQPYLPPVTSSWNATVWGGLPVPEQFLLDITWAAPAGFSNGTGLASDHPFAGPTGPAACGLCFPSDRVSQSRYFGAGGAYCPSGTTLSDGLCDVEFMIDVNPKCVDIVVDDSWGRVKSLYR